MMRHLTLSALALIALLVMVFTMMIVLVARGSSVAQIDPTYQQETIDAAVSELLAQTAQAQESLAVTQTVQAALDVALTATAEALIPDRVLAVLEGHTGPVNAVVWSPDGTRLASGGNDRTVRIWDTASWEELAVLTGHRLWVTSVAWSPDGTRLASASLDGNIRVWDVATWEQQTDFVAHERNPVETVAWSPDGTRLASGGRDNKTRIWDSSNWEPLAVLTGYTWAVLSVAWSPDGTRLAATADSNVSLWDTASWENVLVAEARANAVAWSPDSTQLISAGWDRSDEDYIYTWVGTAMVWDAVSGDPLLLLKRHTDHISSVAWSPDGSLLVSSGGGVPSIESRGDNTVRIWDAKSGAQLAVLEDHTDSVHTVAWSPDGTRIASASEDGTVRIWGP